MKKYINKEIKLQMIIYFCFFTFLCIFIYLFVYLFLITAGLAFHRCELLYVLNRAGLALRSREGFNGTRSGDSVTMETKTPKRNHAQMSFSNTSYEIDFIIITISICNEVDRYGKKEAGTGEHLRHFNNKINKYK